MLDYILDTRVKIYSFHELCRDFELNITIIYWFLGYFIIGLSIQLAQPVRSIILRSDFYFAWLETKRNITPRRRLFFNLTVVAALTILWPLLIFALIIEFLLSASFRSK